MVILMKSVLIGGLAALAISIAAGAVLSNLNPSAGQAYSTSNVRIN